MEIFKTAVSYLQKKLGLRAKTEEAEAEQEIGSYSMNEGKPDKVFGFRREIVKGVAVFFGTVLVLALIFASSNEVEEAAAVETLPPVGESEIARAQNPRSELPNDYETLVAMNKAREEELRRQAEDAAKRQTNIQREPEASVIENKPPAVSPARREVLPEPVQEPVISEPVILPEIPPVVEKMPEPVAPPPAEETVKTERKSAERLEGRYKSAISFSISNHSIEVDAPTGGLVKSEYSAPDESTLIAGTIIPVRLLTGINTDVAGQVMAQVLTDVYDTATGTKLLIPQGSKLTGTYDGKEVSNGRVPVSFKQLILPDGGSWSVAEKIVAVDGAGYMGISGKVHHHTGQKISAGAVGSAIAALGSVAAGNVSTNDTYSAGQIAAQGALANMISATSSMMKDATNVANTVTIDPGYEFSVYVASNIAF